MRHRFSFDHPALECDGKGERSSRFGMIQMIANNLLVAYFKSAKRGIKPKIKYLQ